MKCRVCGTSDKNKPMVFRGENYCCERHRKLIAEEPKVEPTHTEWITMDRKLFDALEGRWQSSEETLVARANYWKGL